MKNYLEYYTDVEYIGKEERDNEIDLILKQNKPDGDIAVRARRSKAYKDIPFDDKPVNLIISQPRCFYKDTSEKKKSFVPDLSFADDYHRITKRLFDYIVNQCTDTSFRDVSKEVGLSHSNVRDIFYEYFYDYVDFKIKMDSRIVVMPIEKKDSSAWIVVGFKNKQALRVFNDLTQLRYWIMEFQDIIDEIFIPFDEDLLLQLKAKIDPKKIRIDSQKLISYVMETCFEAYKFAIDQDKKKTKRKKKENTPEPKADVLKRQKYYFFLPDLYLTDLQKEELKSLLEEDMRFRVYFNLKQGLVAQLLLQNKPKAMYRMNPLSAKSVMYFSYLTKIRDADSYFNNPQDYEMEENMEHTYMQINPYYLLLKSFLDDIYPSDMEIGPSFLEHEPYLSLYNHLYSLPAGLTEAQIKTNIYRFNERNTLVEDTESAD